MRLRALASVALVLAVPASARASDLYVDAHATGCSDAVTAAVAASSTTPWCSGGPAAKLAQPGDVVHFASATYSGQLRPLVSGTPARPIVYEADGPVTLAAPDGTVSVMVIGVHDVQIRGFTVKAAAPQAIWVDAASRILFSHDTVADASGVGIQIKGGTAVTVARSRLINNARAGLFDMAQAHGTTLSGSIVSANGHDGQKYDGDGVELDGTGALVTGNHITDNGDSAGFEHGIYAGASARGYTIAGNTIGGNAGADVKAAGGPALVIGNRLRSSLFGVVLSDNPVSVTVEYNLIQGTFQHGILVTTGHTPARARLWNNTVEQTGRATGSGNASALFVVSAARLELRNNLFAYTSRDGHGSSVMIDDAAKVGRFVADSNWYASTGKPRLRIAWNGSGVSLAQWRSLSGQDASSIESGPPGFASSGRVSSGNRGAAHGERLGLKRDYAGTRIDPRAHPDIGAFQHAG